MEAESNVPWGSVLPPEVKLCRFRDNINCLCPAADLLYWIHTLRGLLTNIYNIPMTVEQAGLSVTFLQVQILCQGTELRWGFKNKLINSMLTPGSTITRYPDTHEPHGRRLVNSIATALGNSAVQVATDQEFITSNLSQAIWGAGETPIPGCMVVKPIETANGERPKHTTMLEGCHGTKAVAESHPTGACPPVQAHPPPMH